MPWRSTTPMDERIEFMANYLHGGLSISDLAERYAISRKTAYKWIDRYEREGPPGLVDRSRRPYRSPSAVSEDVVDLIVAARQRHPRWGPKKLLQLIHERDPDLELPAISTAADILKRKGLIKEPRKRRKIGHPGPPVRQPEQPNDLWCTDFKGEFKLLNGRYCYPLTITDQYSRFLIGCDGLTTTACAPAKKVFTRIFREYGMPMAIRSDNGVPFATPALARLSALSVWWVRLDIYPELIEPGHPQQNGCHERMHRTLKDETTRPPEYFFTEQQRRFDQFRQEYNEVRPHESLGQIPPARKYCRSNRPFPNRLKPLEYPDHFEVRYVSKNGGIRWHSQWVNVSHVLQQQHIGLEEVNNDIWAVYFGSLQLGWLNERTLRIEDKWGRSARKKCYPCP